MDEVEDESVLPLPLLDRVFTENLVSAGLCLPFPLPPPRALVAWPPKPPAFFSEADAAEAAAAAATSWDRDRPLSTFFTEWKRPSGDVGDDVIIF